MEHEASKYEYFNKKDKQQVNVKDALNGAIDSSWDYLRKLPEKYGHKPEYIGPIYIVETIAEEIYEIYEIKTIDRREKEDRREENRRKEDRRKEEDRRKIN